MADVIKIGLPTISSNITCYLFNEWANHYLLALGNFPKRIRFSLVRYFLCAQALELGLKAFLSWTGASRKELKDQYGHDLSKLFDAAKQKGIGQYLKLKPTDQTLVEVTNKKYSAKAGKQLQYAEVGWVGSRYKDLPDLVQLTDLARRVVRNARLRKAYLNA